jgi:hypothetical protein
MYSELQRTESTYLTVMPQYSSDKLWIQSSGRDANQVAPKLKPVVLPLDHEEVLGEWKYTSTLLTSALDGGE